MNEKQMISRQIAELTRSIARRKRVAAQADAVYAAVVRKSIELDEHRLSTLWTRLADWK